MRPPARPALVATSALALGLSLATPASSAPSTSLAPAADSATTAKSYSALTLRTEPLWSGIGEQIEISGELFDRDTYRALPGRPLRLDSKPAGTSTWTPLANLETSSSGSFRLVRTADRARTYRVVYRGNTWYYGDTSSWVNQIARSGTHTRVSAYLKADGTGTRVNGRATRKWNATTIRPLMGAYITIQRADVYSGYFSDRTRVKTNAHGYYTWKTAAAPQQCHRYRAIYKGNSTWAPKSVLASWSSCT